MKLFGWTKKEDKTDYVPQAEDFTHQAIQKAVLKLSLEHPLTIYPFVISIISLLYLVLIGLNIDVFAITLGGGAVSIGSWIYHFFIIGDKLAREHVETLRKLRQKNKFDEIDSIRNTFIGRKFKEGSQAASELRLAYKRLHNYLLSHKRSNDLHVQHFIVLAEDAFEKGVNILRQVLQTFLALRVMDNEKLRREIELWKNELSALNDFPAEETKRKALEVKIQTNENRLKLFSERSDEIVHLLAECERIEGALDSAYLQVIELIEKDPDQLFKGDTVIALEQAVTAASNVEKSLKQRQTGYEDMDEEYLEAGKDYIKKKRHLS